MAKITVNVLRRREAPEEAEVAFRFGGRPLVEASGERTWPTCATCKGPMQFLGQIPGEQSLVSIFMCQNDPGMCDEWDPDKGGNAAWVVDTSGEVVAMDPPDHGKTALKTSWGASTDSVQVETDDVDEYETPYGTAMEMLGYDDVIGSLGGEPAWVQADETPTCASCSRPMHFVANLEEEDMNFGGGGLGYVFRCACGAAKFLWQQ